MKPIKFERDVECAVCGTFTVIGTPEEIRDEALLHIMLEHGETEWTEEGDASINNFAYNSGSRRYQ